MKEKGARRVDVVGEKQAQDMQSSTCVRESTATFPHILSP